MSQFYKRFLAEEPSRLSPGTGRYLALGAFGKHPGWDDHIEDLGLETESLTLAKRLIYVEGVGGQIDAGAWEKLEPAQRIEGFNHLFVWQRSSQFLLGRMWSSSDGKGRTRYPMVLCAHCVGVSLPWGLEHVLPRLLQVEQACKAAPNSAGVRSAVDQARSSLRGLIGQAESDTEITPALLESVRKFVADPVFGPELQGWFRILYQIQNQMAPFTVAGFNSRGDLGSLRPQQIRLLVGANSAVQALVLWRRFFAARIERSVPILLALADGEPWLDAILGQPSTQEFFCLRARPAALPSAIDVPYDLNEAFRTSARAGLADFQNLKSATARAPESPPEESGGWMSVTRRWFRGKGK